MFYLVSQFVPLILVALLIGVVVGWLIWGGADDELDDVAEGGDATHARAEAARLNAKLRLRDGEVADLRSKVEELTGFQLAHRGELDQVRIAHSTALKRVSELESQGANGFAPDASADFVALRSSHERALSEIEQLRAERSGLQARVAVGLDGDPAVAQDQANRIADLERSLAAERELSRTEVERARAQLEGARHASEQARALAEHAAGELERIRAESARSEAEGADLADKLSNSAFDDQVMALQEERDNARRELDAVSERLRELMTSAEQRAAELEGALDDARRAIDEARAAPQAKLHPLQLAHEQFRVESAQAISNANARAAAVDAANSRLASELAALRSGQENKVYELQRALSDERFRHDAAQTELGRLAAEVAVLRATSGIARAPSVLTSSYGASLFPRAAALPTPGASSRVTPSGQPFGAAPDATPSSLPTHPSTPSFQGNSSSPEGSSTEYFPNADNLEDLIGIEPVLAARLRDLGVTSFRQIGEWTDADVDRFQSYLSDFPDRVRRDDWVGGARQTWERRYGRPWTERALVDGIRP